MFISLFALRTNRVFGESYLIILTRILGPDFHFTNCQGVVRIYYLIKDEICDASANAAGVLMWLLSRYRL